MSRRASGPGLGVAAGVICCAALPAIDAVLRGITITANIGVAGGVLALSAGAILLARARGERRSYRPTAGGPTR